jgi:phospholipid/cholesterol/gamma-HCH transport system substrate-binding protein
VPLLLSNLTSVGRVLNVYIPNVRQILIILPAGMNLIDAATMDSGVPGSANADFVAQLNNPPGCTQGYSIPPRDPYDTTTIPPPKTEPYCKAPANSPIDVRGERNSPCPNNPAIRSATAAGCGLYFGATAAAGSAGSSSGDSAGTYDPATGLLVGPDGVLYSAGEGTLSGNGPGTLAGLLKQTLGT